MKLDRNIKGNKGRGKYALVKLRVLADCVEQGPFGGGLPTHLHNAIKVLEVAGAIDYGDKPETEFFVIRLKDKYAGGALKAYAIEADFDGEFDYAHEVMNLAMHAGTSHPLCKKPD